MIAKLLEVRDDGTFLPVIAIQCEPACERERYLLARCGYGRLPAEQQRFILLSRLHGDTEMRYDAIRWGGRTLPTAHKYIKEHWDDLATGDVIDVEFIRGETEKPKASEQVTAPGWGD